MRFFGPDQLFASARYPLALLPFIPIKNRLLTKMMNYDIISRFFKYYNLKSLIKKGGITHEEIYTYYCCYRAHPDGYTRQW